MKSVKIMLTGIAVLLAVIIFHLFIITPLWTDFFAVIGLVIILIGIFIKA